MLKLDGVEIVYGDWRLRANLALEPGSTTALIGPSGAGKSALLEAIAGFLEPERGGIYWEGRDITDASPSERPVTFLFQDNNLFAHLDAAQNVGLGLRPGLRLNKSEQDRVDWALAEVGLKGMGARRPSQLSGGQRQRVALARALLRRQPLLLLDEPFAALGPGLRSEMLELTARIRAGQDATLLIVTHDPEDARTIAPQIVVVADGVAAPPAPTDTLFADPPPSLAAYLGHTRGAD